jgi:hypothetical protein
MAFTGTPVIKKVSDKMFRITGVSLAGDASGTIGFSDKTSAAEVSMVAPDWKPYKTAGGNSVTLQDAIKVSVNPVTDVTTPVPISVVKTGTTHADFVITLHNDTAATAGPEMEIYVQFHD